MATKLFPTKRSAHIYVIVKSQNKKIGEETLQSDEIISTHKTRQGAEQKIREIRPTVPTRAFTRYQIRKFVLDR
jgi:hypothetical protein